MEKSFKLGIIKRYHDNKDNKVRNVGDTVTVNQERALELINANVAKIIYIKKE